MSFAACLAQLVKDKAIDPARAQRFRELYAQMEKRFRAQYGDTPGAVLAGEETLRALEYDAALRRRQAALQIKAQMDGLGKVERFAKGDARKGAAGIISLLTRDPRRPERSIEGLTEVLDFQAHGKLAGFLDKHSRNLLGQVRDKAGLEDVLRARHGDKIDNPLAQAFSDAIGEVFEMQRQRFNLLGGDIGYDAKYGVTHRWDARRVRAVSFDQFRDTVLPELDPNRMVDPLTGGQFTAEGLDDALRAVYETIRTDGLSGLGSGEASGSRKLANRRSDARFLQFRDGDAWLRVNAAFGASDPFSAIMNQVHGMNRDIAMMEVLGPNPQASLNWLIDQAKRRLAQGDDPSPAALNRADSVRAEVEKVWRVLSGQSDIPVLGGPVRSAVVKALHADRDLITAAKLGKAVLAAWGDMGTINMAKGFNGLRFSSTLIGYLRELGGGRQARDTAAFLELGMRDATNSLFGLNRYFGETQGPAVTKVIADTSLRITGLHAFTEAGQRHFGKAFLGTLALERGKAFEQLNPTLRGKMEGYGISAADWDAMRASPLHDDGGQKFMAGPLVRESSPAAAEKMMDMVLSETAKAVQMSTVRGRALLDFGNPGTFAGEASRGLLQFKSFTASLIHTHMLEIMASGLRASTLAGAAQVGGVYLARMAIALTLMGAVTLQLRQLSYGQDFRPMDDWHFWLDAFVTGGSGGPFADALAGFERPGGDGLGRLIAGPQASQFYDIGKASIGNAFRAWRGDETHVERDLVDLLRKNTPGSNTWYASLAFNRLIIDQLRELADPDYQQSYNRLEQRAQEQGTQYWWAPGEHLPERAPDLSNITEGKTLQ